MFSRVEAHTESPTAAYLRGMFTGQLTVIVVALAGTGKWLAALAMIASVLVASVLFFALSTKGTWKPEKQ